MTHKTSQSRLKTAVSLELDKNKGWLIATTVLTVINIISTVIALNLPTTSVDSYTSDIISNTNTSILNLIGFISIILLIYSLSTFSYLYSRQKQDFYQSLPLTKQDVFNSKIIVGLVIVAISFVGSLFNILVEYLFSFNFASELQKQFISSIPNLILTIIISSILFILLFLLASLISVSVTKKLHYWFVFVGVFVALPCDIISFLQIPRGYLFGYNSHTMFAAMSDLLYDFDNNSIPTFNSIKAIIVCIVLCAVSVAVYFVDKKVFVKRKSEYCDNAKLPLFIKVITIVAYALAGFGVCVLITINYIYAIVIGVAFAFIAMIISNFILDKKAVKKYSLISTACVCVLICGVMICFEKDFLGYETYIPNTDQIVSVDVTNNFDDDNNDKLINLKDKNAISTVVDTQKDIIKLYEKDNTTVSIFNLLYYSDQFAIEYNMSNGKKIKRAYPMYEDYNLKGILACDEYKQQNPIYSEIKQEDIAGIKITSNQLMCYKYDEDEETPEIEKNPFLEGMDGLDDDYDDYNDSNLDFMLGDDLFLKEDEYSTYLNAMKQDYLTVNKYDLDAFDSKTKDEKYYGFYTYTLYVKTKYANEKFEKNLKEAKKTFDQEDLCNFYDANVNPYDNVYETAPLKVIAINVPYKSENTKKLLTKYHKNMLVQNKMIMSYEFEG